MENLFKTTSKRVLEPIERISEVLFGIIIVLTFTGSLSVMEAGRQDVRKMLAAALGCNFAWGLIGAISHVLIVGYQGDGSLGRRLVDGKELVSIHGEKIAAKAKVHTLGGFSAHAGQTDLLSWFSAVAPCKPRVVLTHGEDEPRQILAQKIQQRFKLKCTLPKMNEVIEL